MPYLIDALSDTSAHVGANYADPGMAHTNHRAQLALKELTGEDFDFQWDAPLEARQAAISKWHEWLRERNAILEKVLEFAAQELDLSKYSVYRAHLSSDKTEWAVSFTTTPARPGAPVILMNRKTHEARLLRGH